MKKNPLAQLTEFGQSFWFDNIQRSMITNGELKRLMTEDDMRGITSNPTIFEKAITSSADYDNALAALIKEKPAATPRDYFFSLAVDDIRNAADILRPVYDKTKGIDGYVSLEVSPDLAYDTATSVSEGKRLFLELNRPNVMIKIPATKPGISAIEQLIADGVNVNATLLFSLERYVEVAQAYLRGIETRHKKGHRVDNIASVASFFVSRVDSILDKQLDELAKKTGDAGKQKEINAIKGTLAIYNAKRSYKRYHDLFGKNFETLKKAGAQPQRLLWASTGTKNPQYSDVLYIEELIGKNTVNTIPPSTASAFKAHGNCAKTLDKNLDNADKMFEKAQALGLNINAAMEQLEKEGVDSFSKSFDNLLAAIKDKVTKIQQGRKSSAA